MSPMVTAKPSKGIGGRADLLRLRRRMPGDERRRRDASLRRSARKTEIEAIAHYDVTASRKK
jgi:hypothetical protein